MPWDPATYLRFRAERDRPFHDLLARIPPRGFRCIVDLGCGTGHQTAVLAERFPRADVVGLDASREMLDQAKADPPRLTFVQDDISTWRPETPIDLVFSNAALHWVADHERLVPRLAGHLAPQGVLAVQMPMNHDAPSHRVVRALAEEWDVGDAMPPAHVLAPSRYVETLAEQGLEADAWTTTYLHRIRGPDDVVAWLEGTTLRPLLARLPNDRHPAFLDALRAALVPHYPGGPGAVFPFTRLFFVAKRPSSNDSL